MRAVWTFHAVRYCVVPLESSSAGRSASRAEEGFRERLVLDDTTVLSPIDTNLMAYRCRRGAPNLEVDYIHAEHHIARVEESMPSNFFTNMGACSELVGSRCSPLCYLSHERVAARHVADIRA